MTTAALILLAAIAATSAATLADSVLRWTSAFTLLSRELHR
ncbi:MAG: hypothetical protein V7686_05600 [Qipengyuania sp.]